MIFIVCICFIDNFKGKVSLKGKEITKNGEKYLQVDRTDITIDTTRLYLNFKRTNQDAISEYLVTHHTPLVLVPPFDDKQRQ